MTHNAFTRTLSPSLELSSTLAHREQLYAELDNHPIPCSARDTLVRELWADTADIAHQLAHDQGLADIAAAIPPANVRLSDWIPFFVSIARLAQSTADQLVNADTLCRRGLLPSSCALAIDDFHYCAMHLVASLDQGTASCARHAMQTLVVTCMFMPGTAVAPD